MKRRRRSDQQTVQMLIPVNLEILSPVVRDHFLEHVLLLLVLFVCVSSDVGSHIQQLQQKTPFRNKLAQDGVVTPVLHFLLLYCVVVDRQ